MKLSVATLLLISVLALSGITQTDASSLRTHRVLQSSEIDAIQMEIDDLVDLIESLNARRQRRINRGRGTRGIDRRIASAEAELESLKMELDDLLDPGPPPPPPSGELVTLDQLVDLALDAGLTLDDFRETFGARSVEELLSRTSATIIRFNDFFSQALRRQHDEVNQVRIETAALFGVQIDVNAPPAPFVPLEETDAPPVITTTDAPPPPATNTDAPLTTDAPPPPATTDALPGNGVVVTLQELAEIAIEAGLTLDDFDNTFGARSVTELLSRTSTTIIRFNDFFSQALRRDREAVNQVRRDTAASFGLQVNI